MVAAATPPLAYISQPLGSPTLSTQKRRRTLDPLSDSMAMTEESPPTARWCQRNVRHVERRWHAAVGIRGGHVQA
ncbi:hypothetical protein GOBAR_DD13253 [Gossypium barbadense]|nr:hypothetical protein GOBAR_DD13253 [Gossypium barbadense]